MKAGQTSKRNGIQDILCPFTKIYITQGSGYMGGTYSHQGIRAVDITNGDGSRAPYYAPFDLKCIYVNSSTTVVWQSLNKVRFSTGVVDYATVLTCHDETINYGVGYVAHQGEQIGNMGCGGQATGIHCHIEFARGHQNMYKNSYGVWGLVNSVEIEDACFMDNTTIISATADWKYLKDVPVAEPKKKNQKLKHQKKNLK